MPASSTLPGARVRTLVVTMLFGVTFVSYLDRVNLSIAAEAFMPVLGLTKGDMAWVFNSFLVGYAIFQVPAGWLGDRSGARRVLGWSTLGVGLLTLLTGLLPGSFARSATGTLILLAGLRFLLGAAQAPAFPVTTQAISHWMPPARRGFGNSAVLMGSSVGSAISGPFISWAVVRFGWRTALGLSAIPAFLVAAAWLFFRRELPTPAPNTAPSTAPSTASSTKLLRAWVTPDILLLSLSYFSEGYLLFMFVSWLYIYLVEVRHFSLLAGGLASSLPWITAIAVTPLGGLAADALTIRVGRVRASQLLIMVGYSLSGILLFVAAYADTRPVAVLALSLSLGALYLAESSFWTVANALDSQRGGVVSGFMNTIGILGGVASNALVPTLVIHGGWRVAFGSATLMGLGTALIWVVLASRLRRSPTFSEPLLP